MKAKNVLKILGITRQTLYNYTKKGILSVKKLPNNRYDYSDGDVYSFIGLKQHKTNTKVISYSRVSTSNQKEQLKAQTIRIYESCVSKGIRLDEQVEDIKSGMSYDRKGFQYIIRSVIQGQVKLVVLENKDRFVRFGFDIIESIFRYFGTTFLILNDSLSNKSYEQELTDDLISIIHYFSMKSYSNRRKLNRIRKELENAKLNNTKDQNKY